MGESLMEQHRVQDDTLRGVNCFSEGRNSDGTSGIRAANYVPAAAVIRKPKRYPELLGVKRSQADQSVRR
jgi:hypothetical protein